MPLRELAIGQSLGLRRGDVVVCVPVYGAYDLFAQCLLSVLGHTESNVVVLICDDASPDPKLRELLHGTFCTGQWPHEVHYLRQPRNVGFVENVNTAISATAPGDIVLLNSDCLVYEGWLSGLRCAAYSESRVATATALTNAGTIVSVPYRNQPAPRLPDDVTPEQVAQELGRSSLRLRPDIPTCVGHCVYICRSAIELVGRFDPAFSPGYEEEVDFSQRCILHGLRHVVADDVFVFHRQAGSFGNDRDAARRKAENHALVADRYRYYDAWVEEVSADRHSSLARSLSVASSAVRGMSVTIDGRCLTQSLTGTQLVTVGVVAGLDNYTDMTLRVLVPDDLGEWAGAFLTGRPHIKLLRRRDVGLVEATDIVHRPYQVTAGNDLDLLLALGRRLVLTQLDDIALRNPGYFPDFDQWRDYRRLNSAALAAADQVVFISRHGAQDARSLELVPEDRINVVFPATDHARLGVEVAPRAPRGSERAAQRPFLLCLGTDFLHKNRLFAIRLLEALIEAVDFGGNLVLAGPTVAAGSSAGEEAAYLLSRPALAARVVDLGTVDEPGKRWLFARAAAVVYSTTYEGFGLTPFEAAEVGTPCLFARHTSLAEILPASAALLIPWDPRESARRVSPVLADGAPRAQLVRSISIAAARFTSRAHAGLLRGVYDKALRSPVATGLALEVTRLRTELEALRGELGMIYNDPLTRGLVGRDAILPAEMRRPVLAVATRPALRKATMALYRVGYALGHPSRNGADEDRRA